MARTAAVVGVATAVAAAVVATAVPASAAPVSRARLEPGSYLLEVGYCAFPVEFVETTNRVVETVWSDGHVSYRGAFKVKITNVDNGKTVSFNASGTGDFYPDGTNRFDGTTIFTFTSNRDTISGLWLTHGTWGTIDTPDGTATISLYGSGSKTNMCDAIA